MISNLNGSSPYKLNYLAQPESEKDRYPMRPGHVMLFKLCSNMALRVRPSAIPPGPKLRKRGTHWAPNLKNGQKPPG